MKRNMRPFLACVEDSRAIASRLAIKRATADPQSMARSTFLSLSLFLVCPSWILWSRSLPPPPPPTPQLYSCGRLDDWLGYMGKPNWLANNLRPSLGRACVLRLWRRACGTCVRLARPKLRALMLIAYLELAAGQHKATRRSLSTECCVRQTLFSVTKLLRGCRLAAWPLGPPAR